MPGMVLAITWCLSNGGCIVNQWSSARYGICGVLGRGTGRHKGRRRDATQFAQMTGDFWMALSRPPIRNCRGAGLGTTAAQ